ncbi:MAG TPA: hypothetical protein VFJ30_09985 [Phycisphaerae bacterium]|nr:hypothetical protein [Phycisphaerae bacterium]
MRGPTIAALIATAVLATPHAGRAEELTHRWVYVSTNMLVETNVESTIKLLDRFRAAGYNGVVLADYKFMLWDRLGERYAANVARVRRACRDRQLACIACVFPLGYSSGLLTHDPHLAAGLPVKDAPFVVRDGRLVPDDQAAQLVNGDFEDFKGDRPAGWDWADEPGKITFIDRQVARSGSAALRMQDIDKHSPLHGHGRIMQAVRVKPFRYYHFSAAVKTENFPAADQVQLAVLAKDATLNHYQPRIAPTQDWKRVHVCFNSLEFEEVRLYLGVWGGKGGKIWFDDARLEPAGLVNLICREGAPAAVTSDDGKITYAEGVDYASLRDARAAVAPYQGDFPVWHDPPGVKVPAGSRLRDGQRVRISYYHTALIHHGQVACCLSEPKVYDILTWQAGRVRDRLAPDGYFMQHDEIRIAGWDAACATRGLTCGQILADNVQRCTAILRKADPGKPVYVWSDMFDPHHNAGKMGRYYLVKGEGPWYGSWEGLDKDVVVVNWHGQAKGRLESLQHFASRGHKQILAGYYDADPARITDWLADAAKVTGVIGVMYTTWRNNYDDLEAFAQKAGFPEAD